MHESLRLYIICKAMDWNHLPVAGGVYDQHPDFMEDIVTIMQIEAKVEKVKKAQEKRQAAQNKRSSGSKRRGR